MRIHFVHRYAGHTAAPGGTDSSPYTRPKESARLG